MVWFFTPSLHELVLETLDQSNKGMKKGETDRHEPHRRRCGKAGVRWAVLTVTEQY